MKYSILTALLAFYTLPAFAGTVSFSLSKDAKITEGGVVRRDAILSASDARDHRIDVLKSKPVEKLKKRPVQISVLSYEVHQKIKDGKDIFTLNVMTYTGSNSDIQEAGLIYSDKKDENGYYLIDTPSVTIKSTSYPYIKDLISTATNGTLNCYINEAEVVVVLTEETAEEQLKIKSVSCN